MNFKHALGQLRQGKGMRLPQWEKDFVVYLWNPDLHFDVDRISERFHKEWCRNSCPDIVPYDYLSVNIKDYIRRTIQVVLSCLPHMNEPYLYMKCNFGNIPWKANTSELYSEDWVIVDC